jgi:hypothetical protein
VGRVKRELKREVEIGFGMEVVDVEVESSEEVVGGSNVKGVEVTVGVAGGQRGVVGGSNLKEEGGVMVVERGGEKMVGTLKEKGVGCTVGVVGVGSERRGWNLKGVVVVEGGKVDMVEVGGSKNLNGVAEIAIEGGWNVNGVVVEEVLERESVSGGSKENTVEVGMVEVICVVGVEVVGMVIGVVGMVEVAVEVEGVVDRGSNVSEVTKLKENGDSAAFVVLIEEGELTENPVLSEESTLRAGVGIF